MTFVLHQPAYCIHYVQKAQGQLLGQRLHKSKLPIAPICHVQYNQPRWALLEGTGAVVKAPPMLRDSNQMVTTAYAWAEL